MAKNDKDDSVIEQKNNEIKEAKQEEQPKESSISRYVAFVLLDNGDINIQLNGFDIEEAMSIVEKGRIKFQNEYELYLRRTVK